MEPTIIFQLAGVALAGSLAIATIITGFIVSARETIGPRRRKYHHAH